MSTRSSIFGAFPHPYPRRPVQREHVAHVEADDLSQAQAGAKRERDDRVVADVAGGRPEDQALLVGRQRGGAKMGGHGFTSEEIHMHGVKGRITRATGGEHRSVYLSDVLGVWTEGDQLHITLQKGDQTLHRSIVPADGLLYEVLSMLYHHGIALNP